MLAVKAGTVFKNNFVLTSSLLDKQTLRLFTNCTLFYSGISFHTGLRSCGLTRFGLLLKTRPNVYLKQCQRQRKP